MIWLRPAGALAAILAIWFAYSWGVTVIRTYNDNISKIALLERDLKLVNSRVASYQTLNARRDAAIAASKCKTQIEYWLKNPDEIPTKFDPFNQLGVK